MSEKEKMLGGVLYDANDPSLFEDRKRCKTYCTKYNSFLPEQCDDKKAILAKLLNKTGANYTIEPNFWCDYGYNIEIGENFYANHNLVILDCAKVKFGDNVFIGPNCSFYTPEHPLDFETRNKGFEYAKPIIVGDNVWFGGNVVVLSGVKIGNNAVIGAGSVVTKDIEDDVVAVGNPCRVIKRLKKEEA